VGCGNTFADAIAGVTFFSAVAPGYLDTFARAFVCMFRITIGSVDWWFEIFPIVESDGSINLRASFFLISYVIVVNWFFFQITIAVLLENCQEAKRCEVKALEEELRAKKQREKALKNPLDPLLLDLSREFISDTDLEVHLEELFVVWLHTQNQAFASENRGIMLQMSISLCPDLAWVFMLAAFDQHIRPYREREDLFGLRIV
jgi:hypothetical protein